MIKVNDINKSNELNSAKTTKRPGEGPSFSSFLSETMKNNNAPVSGAGNISIADAILPRRW